MPKLKILSSRDLKDINKAFMDFWGIDIKLNSLGYAYLMSNRNKVYAITKEISRLDLGQLKIDTMGIYLFYWDGKTLRLSIEGSQMFGPLAKKNVIEIDDRASWLCGEDILYDIDPHEGFAIVRSGRDYIGCGRFKDGKILNYVPKNRTITEKI